MYREINSCTLKALPEYVGFSDESYVYTKHNTCNCDKHSMGQAVVSAQLRRCRKAERKKVSDFWLFCGEIEVQLIKKYTLTLEH